MNAQDTVNKLIEQFPEFKEKWDASVFKDEDGSFNFHALFMEFSDYIRDVFDSLDENTRQHLFTQIESWANMNPEDEEGISDAVYTCFIEDLATEEEIAEAIAPYLGPNSKIYFDSCYSKIV
jgi:hypothetical protein